MVIVTTFLLLITLLTFFIPAPKNWTPETFYLSIIFRCVIGIILIFLQFFPAFGKKRIGRYVAFVATTLGLSLAVMFTWEYLENHFGFMRTFLGLCILSAISLVIIIVDNRQWEKNRREKLIIQRHFKTGLFFYSNLILAKKYSLGYFAQIELDIETPPCAKGK